MLYWQVALAAFGFAAYRFVERVRCRVYLRLSADGLLRMVRLVVGILPLSMQNLFAVACACVVRTARQSMLA